MMGHSLRRALRAMDKESQWTPRDVLLASGSWGRGIACAVRCVPYRVVFVGGFGLEAGQRNND